MTAWLRRASIALVGIAVAVYALVVVGRGTGSAVFLGLSASTMLAALFLLGGAILSLFVEPPVAETAVATGRRKKELEREKAALLKAIKELEFDHEMRKVSDADFAEIGGNYRSRAIRVMRQLDEGANDYERMVREEVSKVRRGSAHAESGTDAVSESDAVSASVAVSESDAVSESESESESDAVSESVKSPACPSCGTANDADAVFCKKCAHRLVASEGVAS